MINNSRRDIMAQHDPFTINGNPSGQTPGTTSDGRKDTGNFDWRARIRPKKGGEDQAYGTKNHKGEDQNSILSPLKERGGIVYPYTPNLFLQGSVDYDEHSQHGSNYPFYTYINSKPATLPVQGQFTANTLEEAQYLLSIFHFLRTITKGYYGDSAVEQGYYGTPPPVLIFEYLGAFGFNKVPVIIRSFNIQLPDGVDYVPVEYNHPIEGNTITYMPTETDIMIEMVPQYTQKKLRSRFDLNAFTSGADYNKGFI